MQGKRVYSPTALEMVQRRCPAALDYYWDGTWRDERPFAVGLAAHAALQAANTLLADPGVDRGRTVIENICRTTAAQLISQERTFEDRRENPLPPDEAFAGVALAEGWLIENRPTGGGQAELGLAVDDRFRPTSWDAENARFRCIFDLISRSDDEEGYLWRTIDEYKTGWSTSRDDLESLQLKMQAVIAWSHFGPESSDARDYVGILQRLIALRTGKIYTRQLSYTPGESGMLIDRWRKNLTAMATSVDATETTIRDINHGPLGRKKLPGCGCYRCPYLAVCQPAVVVNGQGQPSLQDGWLQMRAFLEMARKHLEAMTEDGPVESSDGTKIGWSTVEVHRLRDDTWTEIAVKFENNVGGLVKASNLTVANLRSILAALYPDFAQAEAEFLRLTQKSRRKHFGIIQENVQC